MLAKAHGIFGFQLFDQLQLLNIEAKLHNAQMFSSLQSFTPLSEDYFRERLQSTTNNKVKVDIDSTLHAYSLVVNINIICSY